MIRSTKKQCGQSLSWYNGLQLPLLYFPTSNGWVYWIKSSTNQLAHREIDVIRRSERCEGFLRLCLPAKVFRAWFYRHSGVLWQTHHALAENIWITSLYHFLWSKNWKKKFLVFFYVIPVNASYLSRSSDLSNVVERSLNMSSRTSRKRSWLKLVRSGKIINWTKSLKVIILEVV